MKKLVLTLFSLLAGSYIFSQAAKTIVVEHFTNTRCGTCASKNPGLYENLENHPEIIHLAIHPSSPYANCALHLHNPVDNDGRTNHYGVYGATPRLVIQGEAQSLVLNFSDPSIFDAFQGQTTPFTIRIKEYRIGSDSVRAVTTIKAESAHSLSEASLFLAYAEDTVFYASPNGETMHHDVLRKTFTNYKGDVISLPQPNDSVVISYTMAIREDWDADRMKVVGILQDPATKSVMQAGVTSEIEYLASIFAGYRNESHTLSIYPNPAVNHTVLQKASGIVELYSVDGKLILRQDVGDRETDYHLDLSGLQNGTYVIRNQEKSSILAISK